MKERKRDARYYKFDRFWEKDRKEKEYKVKKSQCGKETPIAEGRGPGWMVK